MPSRTIKAEGFFRGNIGGFARTSALPSRESTMTRYCLDFRDDKGLIIDDAGYDFLTSLRCSGKPCSFG